MALDMAKFLARFVEEAREHIEKLNNGLVHLEKNPDDHETINSVFRSAHTIKGSSRMMKLTSITEVAHKMEDVLGALRDKKIKHSKELADILFKGIDAVTDMIDMVAAKQEITADYAPLCDELARAAEGKQDEKKMQDAQSKIHPPLSPLDKGGIEGGSHGPLIAHPAGTVTAPPEQQTKEPSEKDSRQKTAETVRISSEKLDELIKLMGEMVSSQNRTKQRLQDAREIEGVIKRNLELVQSLNNGNNGGLPDEIVRSTHKLLGLSRRFTAGIRDDANIYELLTKELQEKALMMRMVPLSTVFDSFQRMVRDIARSMDKEVDLVVEGENVELDKKMVEKLIDPLIHMLRNSVDHGLEKPQDWVKAGKPPRGTVKISAYYDAGSVVIEISDDGGGIDLSKIKEKALRKNMFAQEEIDAMPEPALIGLIFQPGFSTSAIITDLSGRGVGMDVVKKNIVEDLRGSINIKTLEGKGAVFYIRLPIKKMKGERPRGKAAAEEKGAINILIVDDSVNTRDIERSILESYGYSVDVAGDGLEALEKAKGFKYDLIITDVEMPRLDGFSLTEKFRSEASYKNTPIIIVTSREKEEDKRRGITVGADAYIVKGSFDQSNLLETVQNLIG